MPGLSAGLRDAAARRAAPASTAGSRDMGRQLPSLLHQSHDYSEGSLYDEPLASPTSSSTAVAFDPPGAATRTDHLRLDYGATGIAPVHALHSHLPMASVSAPAPTFPSPDHAADAAATDAAGQARRDWRTHGTGLSAALEDMRNRGPVVVRLAGAQDRFDASGARFTAYELQVRGGVGHGGGGSGRGPHADVWAVERRYSEFAKLHDLVARHGVVLQDRATASEVAFPRRHWAGRVGNWTPALAWAPAQHEDLIKYRTVQLDIWLVHLVDWYNRTTAAGAPAVSYAPSAPAALLAAVWQFLSETYVAPCHQENASSTPASSSILHYDWKRHNPVSFSLSSCLRQATQTVMDMTAGTTSSDVPASRRGLNPDRSIPLDLLQAARGLVFMTVLRAGLVVSGRVGSGLVVARLPEDGAARAVAASSPQSSLATPTASNRRAAPRWSAPCALGTVGLGWGAVIGSEVTHYLIVLTTDQAVRDMVASKSVQLGAELGVAVGPVGRGANGTVSTGDWTLHPAYAYAHSQGLFAGISLEGSIVTVRNDVNAKFYNCNVNATDLIRQPGPKAAEPLYEALDRAIEAPIPLGAFRPSQFLSPEKAPMNPCSTFPPRDGGNPQQHPPHNFYRNHQHPDHQQPH